ncbi:DUF1810 domain-containing protein [Acidovorax sp. SRB_24]|uniref:DUF1810 domain-containing protein n=1 Tax=Acidovorax sp. SRB_24 TaxID=1962700 RepID=UPI001F10EC17|nr:DUF1810 domain-containing protein [Acidovorax sp. SRB_24]
MPLQRFLTAQEPVYEQVLAELHAGKKTSHWMWFIFPQLKELGRSATAQFYGIASQAEAQEYARHAVLGMRLKQCSQSVLEHRHKTAHEIFGSPDDMKLRSCMTLFALAAPGECVFTDVLDAFYPDGPDLRTREIWARTAAPRPLQNAPGTKMNRQ